MCYNSIIEITSRAGLPPFRFFFSAIAFAKAADYVEVNEDGVVKIKPTAGLTDEQKSAIAGIKKGVNGL